MEIHWRHKIDGSRIFPCNLDYFISKDLMQGGTRKIWNFVVSFLLIELREPSRMHVFYNI